MEYKEFTKNDGDACLRCVWNVFLTKKEDLFITPFGYSEKRYRTIFKEEDGKLVAYFHVTKEELGKNIDLSSKPEKIYMYGAFNQIEVHQIRSYGKIREMAEEEKNDFIKIIKGRFNGEKQFDPDTKYCPNSKGLDRREKETGLEAINSEGFFFRFDPIDYKYNVYERG